MKKYSIAVCVCAVLFSVGIHGGGMREVFARAPGADENLAILQDIIRENECQVGMAFLGYTYRRSISRSAHARTSATHRRAG